ncbi:sensor histidine kinase [Paenibacillus eucommiae]|uniref:sensor histidine kinase n=1 Tax=Paenibacillus eucommiae TaxID=1355755 RepID=UPI001AEA5E52|nr:HAMP domain-containing sensor histidine kinase [Paenibacillus eucommiae]
MTIIKEFLLQLFFTLMPFVMFNVYYRDKAQNYSQKFIMVTSACCLFLSMTFGSSVKEGIFFDIRYIIMYFGIVFGGTRTGIILLLEFVVYRFFLGGEGKWIAMVIMLFTFPLSLLFYKIYQKTSRVALVTFIAGIVFSIVPSIITFSYFDSNYFTDDLAFHMLVIPVQNSFGIWLLISLFNKSVSDKVLFIQFAENEKVKAISHVAASLAHEVRNPLTAVKGFLTLIREKPLERHKLEQYIDISIDEIQRTESILSQYLSISKPLSTQREQTEMSNVLQVIKDVMTPFANMSNVQLEIDKPAFPVWILANQDGIKQILVNFIKNAIEACSDIPKANVSLRLKVEAGHVILVIKDNGIGMNADQINRLGTIYFSTKSSGTGLGLTFSYKVIRALGGTVSVQSGPLEGTVFTITLPMLEK